MSGMWICFLISRMAKRRVTKPVYVGGVKVGGGADITVQSMTKTDTRDVAATVRQIHELEEAGCEIIRSAVPDLDAALRRIAQPAVQSSPHATFSQAPTVGAFLLSPISRQNPMHRWRPLLA